MRSPPSDQALLVASTVFADRKGARLPRHGFRRRLHPDARARAAANGDPACRLLTHESCGAPMCVLGVHGGSAWAGSSPRQLAPSVSAENEVFGSERLSRPSRGVAGPAHNHAKNGYLSPAQARQAHIHSRSYPGDERRQLPSQPEPKTAETAPKNLTTQPMVDPVGPQAPPTLLRFA